MNKNQNYNSKLKTIFICFLIINYTFNFSFLTFNSAFAQEATSSAIPATESATISSPVPTNELSPPDIPFDLDPTPTLTPPLTLAPSLSPTQIPESVQTSASSASLRRETILQPLPQKDYRADASVTAILFIAQGTEFKAELFNSNQEKQNIIIDRQPNADFTTLRILPSLEFRPGLYTLKVSDSAGFTQEAKFNWGMINFNTDSSIYKPGDAASFSLGVTDEKGQIVCDANINLKIKNGEELSTDNGKVLLNPDCTKHDFNLKPDYQATYKIPEEAGTYKVKISAMIKDKTYQIEDSFEVEPDGPFRIARSYPTRLTSPRWHPMSFTLVARTDFTGTVSERLPASVDIAPSDDPSLSSYDSLSYVDTNLNSGTILGVSIPSLQVPFAGSQSATLGFGENLEDPLLIRLYSQFNLSGHDGVDFDLAEGTPVLAADSGMISLAGDGDYGTTIAIDHAWGRSYYGHLSKLDIVFGQRVSRGQQIGLSGNTGLSTGAHLHFGIKPKRFDKNNGYYGKINPLPYLEQIGQISQISPIGETSTAKAKLLFWNFSLKKGESQTFGYQIKVPTQEASSYLAGPFTISYESQPNVIAYFEDRLWQMTTDVIPQAPGASFPENTEQFPMETIDPKLFDVPEDYSFVKAKLDKELKGKYANLFLESTSPSFQMVYASPSAQLNGFRLTFDHLDDGRIQDGIAISNQVKFEEILPNIDYSYETYDGYINQKIILKNDTTDKDFAFNLELTDNLEVTDYFGHALIKDKITQEEFFLFRFPQGIDAKNQRIDYKYKIENGRLILYPARAWQLERAVYPITIYAPVNVTAWDEVSVGVGENCAEPGCSKDGDVGEIKPVGWYWGSEERKKNVILKIEKVNEKEREELSSNTIDPPDRNEDGSPPQLPEKVKDRINSIGGLPRYGIDYTQIANPSQLRIIRNKEKKEFSPTLDARSNKSIFQKKAKEKLLSSVIPEDRRLAYQPEEKSLFSLIWEKLVKPVHAAVTVTKTIGSAAGRDFSAIQNGSTGWEDVQDGDLVTRDTVEQGLLYNDSTFSISAVQDIDGSTTDSTRYMHLTVAPSERHNGTVQEGVLIQNSSTTDYCLALRDNFTRLEWVKVSSCASATAGIISVRVVQATDVLIQNVIIYNFSESTQSNDGIRITGNVSADSYTVRNSLIYDGDRTGIMGEASNAGDTITIENVTIDGMSESGGDGIHDRLSVATVKNVISMNNAGDDFVVDTSGSTMDNNLCEDNASDCGINNVNVTCTNCQTNKTRANQFVSVSAGSEDFHLKSGSDAIDTGTNLSANFANDIDDTVRTYGPWDIGADEFPSRLLDSLMRHGKYFGGSDGSEQPFTF